MLTMFREFQYINKYKHGYVGRGIADGGASRSANFCDIRAAIVEPVNDIPCYYLILGQLDRPNMWGKKPFVFIAEFEDGSANRAFKNLLDDCERLSVLRMYANRQSEGFYGRLWRYRQEHGMAAILQPVICREDVSYGDSLITETIKDKALVTSRVNKSTMSQQINQIKHIGYGGGPQQEPDFAQYYAWNALRYVLAGYIQHPTMERGRLAENDIGNPRKWDSHRTGSWQTQNFSQWAV